MTKLKVKWLEIGTTGDGASAQSFPVGFTPANFTPAEVGSEGADKTSAFLKGIDTKLGALIVGVGFTDQLFTGDGTTTRFSPTLALTSGASVDVLLNGVLMTEDGTSGYGWHRDVTDNQVVTLLNGAEAPFPSGARLRVRDYTGVSFSDQIFTGSGSVLTVSTGFTSTSRIDVYFNGQMAEEGPQYSRNTGTNQITILSTGMSSVTKIRVRVWN
jgi:hypothetical protein